MSNYFSFNHFSFDFDQQGSYFFDDISLNKVKHRLTFIVGKNGVGKSTFFRLLQGIVYPGERISGILNVNEHSYDLSIPADRDRLHKKSLILHQQFDAMLVPHFTGEENLRFAQFPQYPGLFQGAKHNNNLKANECLQIPLEKPVHLLSGGQRQLLALVMVTQRPLNILLLDEPTAALDTKNSEYVIQGIATLARENNITILCISHDNEIINRYADHVIEISETSNGKRIIESR